MAERDAAGVQLMHEALMRWRDAPPVTVTLERTGAWTVLLALQAAVAHPGFGGSSWAPALVTVGRQIQELACDDAEIYATAERGGPAAPAPARPPSIRTRSPTRHTWSSSRPPSRGGRTRPRSRCPPNGGTSGR